MIFIVPIGMDLADFVQHKTSSNIKVFGIKFHFMVKHQGRIYANLHSNCVHKMSISLS